MSSIVEQNLLWKAYQQHKSILNNCSLFDLNKQHIVNTTNAAVYDGRIDFDDDLNNGTIISNNSNNNVGSGGGGVEISHIIGNNGNIGPCDPKLMSDIGSIIKQLDYLINASDHQILDESMNDTSSILPSTSSSSSSFSINQARSDQFYIEYPHDMLHPSMNPCTYIIF